MRHRLVFARLLFALNVLASAAATTDAACAAEHPVASAATARPDAAEAPSMTASAVTHLGAKTTSAAASLRTVTDDTGQQVTLPSTPTRIVSLAPGATEMLF